MGGVACVEHGLCLTRRIDGGEVGALQAGDGLQQGQQGAHQPLEIGRLQQRGGEAVEQGVVRNGGWNGRHGCRGRG